MERIRAALAVHRSVRRATSLMMALVLAAGLLTAGFAGPATAAVEYSFWQADGCRYSWTGPDTDWRRGDCGPADQVGWGRGSAAHQWYHWDGDGWQFQGIYSQGTMDTPNGIFIVPFVSETEEHLFVYDYAGEQWYHLRIVTQSVQASPITPELETTSGWQSLRDVDQPMFTTMVREWESLRDSIINVIPAQAR